jgi:hypothetical protein
MSKSIQKVKVERTKPGGFSYAALSAAVRSSVEEHTAAIHARRKLTKEAYYETGLHLIAVKDQLDHGQFGAWLTTEFGWEEREAQRMMSVAKRFKSDIITHLNAEPTALLMLVPASDATVAKLIKQGDKVRVSDAKAAVAAEKAKSGPAAASDAKPVIVPGPLKPGQSVIYARTDDTEHAAVFVRYGDRGESVLKTADGFEFTCPTSRIKVASPAAEPSRPAIVVTATDPDVTTMAGRPPESNGEAEAGGGSVEPPPLKLANSAPDGKPAAAAPNSAGLTADDVSYNDAVMEIVEALRGVAALMRKNLVIVGEEITHPIASQRLGKLTTVGDLNRQVRDLLDATIARRRPDGSMVFVRDARMERRAS